MTKLQRYRMGFNDTDGAFEIADADGEWVRYEDAQFEIDQLRAALKVAQQAILEFSAAQERGPSWYTRSENGMYQQVSLWLRRGLEAVREALGPYDDNGQYLKEMPATESGEGLHCAKCGELYTGRGGPNGGPMILSCPNGHSWPDPRPELLQTGYSG